MMLYVNPGVGQGLEHVGFTWNVTKFTETQMTIQL